MNLYFVDSNGKNWLVKLIHDDLAILFEDGFEIFRGTLSQVKGLGLKCVSVQKSPKVFGKSSDKYN
jgi:hypothetical protein